MVICIVFDANLVCGLRHDLGVGALDDSGMSRISVPLQAHFSSEISAAEEKQLELIAKRLTTNQPTLNSIDAFGSHVGIGMLDGPALLIGDHREIALGTPQSAERYEYRISTLGAEGDLLLIGGNRDPAYERYREVNLGLGAIDVIELPAPGPSWQTPLAKRCLADPAALDLIVERARQAGQLAVLPYIGSGSVWVLAGVVAEHAKVPVHVAAPPPNLTRCVNDKVWFSRRVTELLGAGAQPRFHSVYGPAALTGYVTKLARWVERVVVKVPDSAGSAGNLVLFSKDIASLSPRQLRKRLLSVLSGIGWRGKYPLLVQVWDSPVVATPSVQIWIPDRQDGPPILEGMFEQIVAGLGGEFVGSVPVTLPQSCTEVIMAEALKLATLFQYLGYFGRCSLDAVVAGTDYNNADLHWIECNGRWGGVSIPMTLANRLVGDWSRQSFVVVQSAHLDFKQRTIPEVLNLLGSSLYQASSRHEGVVLISPRGTTLGHSINLMAIAETDQRAQTLARQAVERLIGGGSPAPQEIARTG